TNSVGSSKVPDTWSWLSLPKSTGINSACLTRRNASRKWLTKSGMNGTNLQGRIDMPTRIKSRDQIIRKIDLAHKRIAKLKTKAQEAMDSEQLFLGSDLNES